MSGSYNGWSNYPTWAVNLWLATDEALYNATRELVSETLNEIGDEHDRARGSVADALKRWVRDDLAPDLGASFAADLLGYALDEVDWYELAQAWLDNCAEAVA